MNDLRRGWIIMAALAATGPIGMLAAGCGSDATGTGVADGSTDGKVDGRLHADARGDVTQKPDGRTGTDSGKDAVGTDVFHHPDTGLDGGSDGGSDGGADGGHDAHITDAGAPDVKALLYAYPGQVDKAFCQKYASCCGNPANFSVATCIKIYGLVGGAVANLYEAVIDSGHLDFDPSAASNCLARIQALNCAKTTTAQETALVAACAAPVKGTVAVGAAGCKSAWDCKQPAYCDKSVDGGKCAATLGALQACKDTEFSQDCTSLGNAPGSFCGPFGSASPTCLTAEGDGGTCSENLQCLSTFCGNGGTTCVSSESFAVPGDGGTCGFFPPDAG